MASLEAVESPVLNALKITSDGGRPLCLDSCPRQGGKTSSGTLPQWELHHWEKAAQKSTSFGNSQISFLVTQYKDR